MGQSRDATDVGIRLSALLADQGRLPTQNALQLVQNLAGQVAEFHAAGQWYPALIAEAIAIDPQQCPKIVRILSEFRISPQLTAAAWLPPEWRPAQGLTLP